MGCEEGSADNSRYDERSGQKWSRGNHYLIGTRIANSHDGGLGTMNVRLLGFRTLVCGCVIGRYRELATSRELTYVEEKGTQCDAQGHRRNHTVSAERLASAATLISAKAS